jgi:ATP-dependent DNA ligase
MSNTYQWNQPEVERSIVEAILQNDHKQVSYLIGIIVKSGQPTLPGFSPAERITPKNERIVLRAFRTAAEELGIDNSLIQSSYGRHPDLYDFARALTSKNANDALRELSPEPFLPIRPAKAIRYNSPQEAWNKTKGGVWLVEPKYDGWYCQIHIAHGKSLLYSRSGKQLDQNQFNLFKESEFLFSHYDLILESEIVPIDLQTGMIMPINHILQAGIHHRAYVFDVLYLDGDMTLQPFRRRRKKLEYLLRTFERSNLSLVSQREITNLEDFISTFHELVESNMEGMIAKRPNATYSPNSQSMHFLKIKSKETLDAVILGYIFNPLSYLVAVRDQDQDHYVPFAWVPTSNSDLLDAVKNLNDSSQPPIITKGRKTDVRIRPEIVVEVEGDSIIPSNRFNCGKNKTGKGWTLYAARFVRIRNDKSTFEVSTVDDFLRLPAKSSYEDSEPLSGSSLFCMGKQN